MKLAIAFLALFLLSCTAIDTSKPLFYSFNEQWDGYTHEGEPGSKNPDPMPEIYRKYHKTPLWKYFYRLGKKVKRYNEMGKWVKEFTVVLHDNAGLNWKRGDVKETIIYFVQKEKQQ